MEYRLTLNDQQLALLSECIDLAPVPRRHTNALLMALNAQIEAQRAAHLAVPAPEATPDPAPGTAPDAA